MMQWIPALFAAVAGDTNLYVSTTGNDANSGALNMPFLTISRAISATNSIQDNVSINLGPGIYRETIVPSTAFNYYLTIRAIIPGTVTIRCSANVTGFTPYIPGTVNPFSSSNVWMAPLQNWTKADWGMMNEHNGPGQKRSINMVTWGNSSSYLLRPSDRLTLAREPDFKRTSRYKYPEYWWRQEDSTNSATTLVDGKDDSWMDGTTPVDIEPGSLLSFPVSIAEAQVWAKDGMPYGSRIIYRIIKSHIPGQNNFTIHTNTNKCGPWQFCNAVGPGTFSKYGKYFVENHPYFLDSPGEYWVNYSSQTIYLIPGAGISFSSQSVLEVGKLAYGMDLRNQSNITVDGLNFEMCENFAINMINGDDASLQTRNIVFRNLTVQLCNRGIAMRQMVTAAGTNRSVMAGITIMDSEFHHIDGAAISAYQEFWNCDPFTQVGCQVNSLYDITIANNWISQSGFRSMDNDFPVALPFDSPHRVRLERNTITDCPNGAIGFSYNLAKSVVQGHYDVTQVFMGEVLVKDNIIDGACLAASNCGGILLYGGTYYDVFWMGNVISNVVGWSPFEFDTITSHQYGNSYDTTRAGLGYGLGIHNASSAYVFGNILMDSYTGVNWWNGDFTAPFIVQNNVFHNCYENMHVELAVGTYFTPIGSLKNNFNMEGALYGMYYGVNTSSSFPPASNLFGLGGSGAFGGYNTWVNNGWDNRTTATDRGGLAELGGLDSDVNYSTPNPIQTFLGWYASWPSVSVGDTDQSPGFVAYDPFKMSTQINKLPVTNTSLFNYSSGQDWMGFALSPTSSAIDSGAPLHPDLLRLFQLFNVANPQMGSQIDRGALEFNRLYRKGYAYPRGMGTCVLSVADNSIDVSACPAILSHGDVCQPRCASGYIRISPLSIPELWCNNSQLEWLAVITSTDADNKPPLCHAPTSSPTSSPTNSPTAAVTWTVDYPTAFVSSAVTTFTIILPDYYILDAMHPPLFRFLDHTGIQTFTLQPTNGLTTLNIAPYNFPAGSTYSLRTIIGPWTAETPLFNVISLPLVVVIDGGDRDIARGSTITFSATRSYDPDFPPSSSPSSVFNFLWSLSPSCDTALQVTDNTGANLTLRALSVSNISCAISVNVSSNGTQGIGRNFPPKYTLSSTSLRVVSIVACNITLSGPSQSDVITSGSTIRLLATVTGTQPLTIFQWGIVPALPSTMSTSSACTFPPGDNPSSRALSFPAACLSAGVEYQFTFTAGNALATSQAGYALLVAAAPTGGSCSISPLIGIATQTMFTVTCLSWTQPGPVPVSLSYSVLFSTPSSSPSLPSSSSSSSSSVKTPLTPLSNIPTISFYLPTSLTSGGTQLVVDVYGYGGAHTEVVLPAITITAATTCPLTPFSEPNSNNYTLSALSVAFHELLTLQTTSSVRCPVGVINTTWSVLWSQFLTAQPAVTPSTVALNFLASVFDIAVQSAAQASSAQMPTNSSTAAVFLPSFIDEVLSSVRMFIRYSQQSTSVTQTVLQLAPYLFQIVNSNCTAMDELTQSFTQLIRTGTAGNLPSDPSLTLDSRGLSVNSAYFFTDSSAAQSISGGAGVNVDLPQSLVSQGGDVSAVTVTSFLDVRDNARCRSSAPGGMIMATSTIVEISLSTREGDAVTVAHVNGSFSFTMPLNDLRACGVVACSWWDPVNGIWNNSGCVGNAITDYPDSYLCTCSHLTEFGLLMRPVECTTYKEAYLVLMGLYIFLAVVIIIKVGVRCITDRHLATPGVAMIVWQHVLMLLLTVARSVASGTLGFPSISGTWSLSARAVALVLPYLLVFWIYTLMVFQWASVFHFGMKYKNEAFGQVRGLFLLCNTLVCASMIALVSTITLAQWQDLIVITATCILAGVTVLTAFAFMIYAFLLYKSLSHASKSSTRNSGNNNGYCLKFTISQKLFAGGLSVCILLCTESAMHLASLLQTRNPGPVGSRTNAVSADISEIVILCADWLSLVVLLVMYHKAMHVSPSSRSSTVAVSGNGKEKVRHPSKPVIEMEA